MSSKRLYGKKCVVTGGAQGIGLAIVEGFLKEGAEVVAVDILEDKLKMLEGRPGLSTSKTDVQDTIGIQKLAEEHKNINVLVNCAGVCDFGTILTLPEASYDHMFDVNVKGIYRITKAFLPQMIVAGAGSIINISSIAGVWRSIQWQGVYCATKAAVVGLTKGIAMDHVAQGIRCNVVCPGSINTTLCENAANTSKFAKEFVEYTENNFMKRKGRPEEVANLCVYLASDESSYHTGNVFTIDGGVTM